MFLVSRTMSVFLFASAIPDASRRPSSVLRSVRSMHWSVEAERLFDQVNNEVVALSGMKFFYLTRKVLLGVSD